MAGNKNKKIIAIDLGGTYLRVSLIRHNKILKYIKKQTPKDKKTLLKELFSTIDELMDKSVKGIGVSSVGPLENGIIRNPPNLVLQNFNLKKALEKRFRVRVEVENDANCVALAESKFGVGKGKRNLIVLTLGTGIGGGIIINNELYKGQGYAGELGHIILDKGEYFENLASWKRIGKLTKQKFGKELWLNELIKMKDKRARKIIQELNMYLGQGIASLINIFDPEVVILGGGMREAGASFLNMIKKQTEKYTSLPKKPNIMFAKLKHPGSLGASLLLK